MVTNASQTHHAREKTTQRHSCHHQPGRSPLGEPTRSTPRRAQMRASWPGSRRRTGSRTRTPRRSWRVATPLRRHRRPPRAGRRGHGRCSPRVPLAVHAAVPLEEVAFQDDLARGALEAVGMVLLTVGCAAAGALFGLEVLALDSRVAGAAQGAVQLVVVLRAVGMVVPDVKVGRLERFPALVADKAGLVVPARQAAVRGADGFPGDEFSAAAAAPSRGRAGSRLGRRLSSGLSGIRS